MRTRKLACAAFASLLVAQALTLSAGDGSANATEIVWTSWFNPVKAYNLESGEIRQLAPDTLATSSVADPSHDAMYYSRYRGIFRTDSSGEQPTTLIESIPPADFPGNGPYYGEIGSPWGIAIDEQSGDLFWGEALYNTGNQWDLRGIRRLNAASGQVEEIYDSTDGTFPRDLFLDQTERQLYFGTFPSATNAETMPGATVSRLNLESRQHEILYQQEVGPVRGLAVAIDKDLIFWNADKRSIKVGSLNGSKPERILATMSPGSCALESLFYHPIEGKLYFGTGCQIGRMNVDGSEREVILNSDSVSSLVSVSIFDKRMAVVPEPTAAFHLQLGLLSLLFSFGETRVMRPRDTD